MVAGSDYGLKGTPAQPPPPMQRIVSTVQPVLAQINPMGNGHLKSSQREIESERNRDREKKRDREREKDRER